MWGHHIIMHKVKTFCLGTFLKNSEIGSSIVLYSGKCGTRNSSINVVTWQDDKQKSSIHTGCLLCKITHVDKP